jgi:hypothetical protein
MDTDTQDNYSQNTINLDTLFGGSDVLEAYRRILERNPSDEVHYSGKFLGLGELLKNEGLPEAGIKRDFLPEHIQGVYVDHKSGDICLEFDGQFKLETERNYWDCQGFKTIEAPESFEIISTDGRRLATYEGSKIRIDPEEIDDFLGNYLN